MNQSLLNPRSITWVSSTLIVLLVGYYAWSFLSSALVLDSARDLFRAIQISRFENYPLLGPDIGGFFHTGPLWFYLLAIPSAIGSLSVVALFVGVLAGLKFVFAYKLGRDLINPYFGVLWTLLLLLPGWHIVSQVFINHTNMLEMLSLLFLLVLLNLYRYPSKKYWLLAALILGLGFQAHPGFLVLIVFYIPLFWQQKIPLNLFRLLSALGLFLLPLLPYLAEQFWHGFPDWQRFLAHDTMLDQQRASGSTANQNITFWSHWLGNMWALIYSGPNRIITFVSGALPQWGVAFYGIYVFLMSLVVLGWLMILTLVKQYRKLLLTTALALLLALFFVTLLRSFTPFYLLLPLTAIFQGLLALGIYTFVEQLLRLAKYVKFSAVQTKVLANTTNGLLVVLFLMVGVLPGVALRHAIVNDHVSFGNVMDVNTKSPDKNSQAMNSLDLIAVHDGAGIAQEFCEKSSVINGPLASVIDVSGALPMVYYCDQFELVLGGARNQQDQSLFVMHRTFWQQTNLRPDRWLTPAWGATKAYQNHHPDQGFKTAVFNDYIHPPRANHVLNKVKTFELSYEVSQMRYLSVSNVLPFNVQFRVDKITANEQAVELVMANAANHLYHCQSCQDNTITWQLTLTTNDFNAIDINTLP